MTEIDSTAGGWYEATGVARPDRPRLNLDLDVDVCVIGAGLAGLTVAREVAQRGWSVVVLEAGHVAWAASGRNMGFVLPGFSEDIDDIIERIGLDHAKQLWALSEQGLEYVRRTILDTQMPGVDLINGWLHVSKTDNTSELHSEVERMRWIGADVEFWPAARVREQLHSPHYFNAAHYRQAFHIDPYNYALGLATLAEKAGARIFEETPAVSLDPAGVRKRIVTPAGRVRAAQVVLAGNIHLGALMPQLAATLLPVTTFVMVTQPLGDLLHEVVRYHGAVSDTNRADNHYRIVGGDRLQWSGRMRAWEADPGFVGRGLIRRRRRRRELAIVCALRIGVGRRRARPNVGARHLLGDATDRANRAESCPISRRCARAQGRAYGAKGFRGGRVGPVARARLPAFAARHEREPLKQVHILFVL